MENTPSVTFSRLLPQLTQTFRIKVIFVSLVLFLLISFYIDCRIGAMRLDNKTFWHIFTSKTNPSDSVIVQILLYIRLPRALAAILIGGTLASTGAVMQGLFRNPLIDPGIVGVMSGASLAVTLSIVLGNSLLPQFFNANNDYALPIASFAGSWAMMIVLYTFSKRRGEIDISVMLLIGIAFGALTMAATGLLTYLSDDTQLRTISFWSMGSLALFDWKKLSILGMICTFSLPLLLRNANILNALLLGENVAGHLGFDIEYAKKQQIFLVALLVGSCVAFSGGIGFVGLVVPHIVRGLLGSNHRLVLPASFLFGAALLGTSDVIARTVVAPAELPIGILMAMIGAPFLGYLVSRGKTR